MVFPTLDCSTPRFPGSEFHPLLRQIRQPDWRIDGYLTDAGLAPGSYIVTLTNWLDAATADRDKPVGWIRQLRWQHHSGIRSG